MQEPKKKIEAGRRLNIQYSIKSEIVSSGENVQAKECRDRRRRAHRKVQVLRHGGGGFQVRDEREEQVRPHGNQRVRREAVCADDYDRGQNHRKVPECSECSLLLRSFWRRPLQELPQPLFPHDGFVHRRPPRKSPTVD